MFSWLSSIYFQPRQNLLSAAGRIGEASHDIMKKVGDEDELDKAFQVSFSKLLIYLIY